MIEMNDVQRKLAEDNLKLVHFTINRYFPLLLGDSEIVSCGYLGLCRATLYCDESKGKFTTYAIRSIRNEIIRELKNRDKQIDCLSLNEPLPNQGEGVEAVKLEDAIDGVPMDITHLLAENFFKMLTEEEQAIYALRECGYKRSDISRITGFNRGKFNTLLRSIKRKYYLSTK